MITVPARPEKLTIVAYRTPVRESEVATFTAQFDPSTYTQTFQHAYQGANGDGVNVSLPRSRYTQSLPMTLSFQLILDANEIQGTLSDLVAFAPNDGLGGATDTGIYGAVDNFLQICYQYNGEIHEPNYLRIRWSSFERDCRLRSVNVQYTMFNRDGTPTRALLDVTFIGDTDEERRLREEDRQSPDLSRRHVVVSGDSLPRISEKAYGSNQYYLDLARYNRLNHFRVLTPGDVIRVPSLEELLAS